MSNNHKAWKKFLPCLALAAILVFGAAMRFPADAISPKPATVQASTGDYFNLAYEKTLEFVQPLWEKIKLFSDQPKDWNEITQNLIKYAKEKPLMAAAVGAGIIWIPFGLFRAFRSKNEEEEDSEYDEFMNSELEDEEDEFEEGDDEEEYQKNLREFNEDEQEDNEEEDEEETIEEAALLEEDEEETMEEAALLEEDETEEEIFEDFESESLEDTDDDFGFLEEDENDDLLFQDEEDDEFAALREEEEFSEDDEFSDIFSESTSDDEAIDPVPTKNFASDTDSSDDVLKKLESEFASLESEFSEVDDFIDQENKKNSSINISNDVDSGSEKVLSHEDEDSSELDKLLSASESLSNLEDPTSTQDLTSDPFEKKEISSNIMDLINKEAVTSGPASSDSSTPTSKKFEIENLEDEEELDQTLKDLQAEMEQTIQEISAQIGSEPEYQNEEESEEDSASDISYTEDEVADDSPFQRAEILSDEENDESSLEEILQKAEEEAEKDLKDLLPESSVFLEEANESTIDEEEIPETHTIPDTVEETFKDVFAEALDSDTFQDIDSEEELEERDLASVEAKSEAESVDDIISMIEDESSQEEADFSSSAIAEEKPAELPDLIEESPEAFDPLLPALDAATHEEKAPKPVDKQIDSVKANSYIKSLGAFQKNLENRLNTLKYFPPIEEAKPPTPKVQEFEIEEPVLTNEPDIDFDHIGESPEKKYSLELMESFILLDNQK